MRNYVLHKELSEGKVDLTFSIALDIFGTQEKVRSIRRGRGAGCEEREVKGYAAGEGMHLRQPVQHIPLVQQALSTRTIFRSSHDIPLIPPQKKTHSAQSCPSPDIPAHH